MKRGITTLNPKITFAAFCVLILILLGSPTFAQTENQVLTINPDEIDLGVMRGTETAICSISISSDREKVSWMVRWVEPWITLDTYSGVVEGETQFITITASPKDFPAGRHQTDMIIATSAGTRTVTVSVIISSEDEAISEPDPEHIFLVPPTVAAQAGRKIQLGAMGVYSDGSEKDITGEVAWVSKDERIGYFFEKDGLLAGKSAGSVRVFAKLGRVTSPVMTIPVGFPEGPLLKASMPRVTLDRMEKGSMETLTLSLRNAGKGELEWEVISLAPWLTIEGVPPWEGYDVLPGGIGYLSNGDTPYVERSEYGRLDGRGAKQVQITVDTNWIPDGDHTGVISIRSNGGDERIVIPITVISLSSISLIPASATMIVNERMLLRATGIWSDGSRTDLSTTLEGRWNISDDSTGHLLRRKAVFIANRPGQVEIRRERGDVVSNATVITVEESPPTPVLLLSAHEVDFGTIGPGEVSKGSVSLQNVGGGELIWQVYGIESWFCTDGESFSETVGGSRRHLRLRVESLGEDRGFVGELFPIRIRLEAGRKSVSYEKYLASGTYREELKLSFNGGERSVFLNFVVAETPSRSCMVVKPRGIDFGSVSAEGKLLKKIELKNNAEKMLKWGAVLQGGRKSFRGVPLPEKGRYVSFVNESFSGKGRYRVLERLADRVDFSGEWTERDGNPCSMWDDATIRYVFSGRGATLLAWKGPYGGIVQVAVDGRPAGEIDLASARRERVEFTVAENLSENIPHHLVITVKDGVMEIEGVRLYSSELIKGKWGWITISPERGTTTNEVDYITVSVTPEGLDLGSYSENIIFYSDEGVEILEVSLDVIGGKTSEFVEIYRYSRGADIRLSPERVEKDLLSRGYRKKGPLFKLFCKKTSGTAEFFHWHNPRKGTSYYSYDRAGGKRSLRGYVFDGPIGNIATLKLPHTRDLYRWFNPQTGAYAYTTDPKGEGYQKKGYVYDGVAGYVR